MAKTTNSTKMTVKSAPTKDTGAVKVGAGSIRFVSVRDAGRVHVGAGSMRF